ncbi:EAL domain-containing protein [Ramlibacter ginsenosidimutans]|uniref:EAL domain-containing protein n=1 Tax=Ramlibacter ginsenosidimutans TaxID=502333 RepID=A0A934WQK9_9BURK|nr:GGDEF domain-containing phosphodiesterase [Ramlibacter ginsenosidimutans]MBK6009437.1 EAL domain-containing protein [Ramlibacter ginsenosidimutans]
MALLQQRTAPGAKPITRIAALPVRQHSPGRAGRPAWLSTAPLPPADELQRLAELRAFDVLDTGADEDFDRLVQLATLLCGAPMGALTFVDTERQWYKARVGLPVQQVARDKSFCGHAILDAERLLEIPDVARLGWADPQPWGPQGPTLRFYAGVPLRTRKGSSIGTLCIMDQVPRRLTDSQRDALIKLAQSASRLLELRRELRIAAETDRLTGLPNWFHFEHEFERCKPACGVLAFVRLKTINQISSAHGFRVADALIQQAADRLRVFAEQGALIGRVKRGLFVLFFPDARAAGFAQGLAYELAASLAEPYEVQNLALTCRVNLGFAACPADGRTLDELVHAADTALQVAIERDQTVAFFDRSVDHVLGLHFRLEPQLRRALERDEFVNHYQPKVDLATGRIVGVEALVRWMDPQRGLVPPGEFVPALESTGLIGAVGQKILARAIVDWRSWRDAGLQPPRIAVNVAAAQLRDDEFVPALQRALAVLDGDASALSIEVTESILISDMERTVGILQQVRALGVPVAIDDFGTGYSSLAYIAALPIDELKIDRAFVQKITAEATYEGIVRTCVSLARNLKLKVVAEGVETQAQAIKLRELQCDQAQGFFYSPPVPADELARLLEKGPFNPLRG